MVIVTTRLEARSELFFVAAAADLHARGKDLEIFSRQWGAAIDAAIENGATLLLIAGDVFDRANVGDNLSATGAVAQAVIQPLRRFVNDGERLVVIVNGDHDQSGPRTASALKLLEPWAHVVYEPEIVIVNWWEHEIVDGPGKGELAIACLPWSWGGSDLDAEAHLCKMASHLATRQGASSEVFEGEPNAVVLAHLEIVGMSLMGLKIREHEQTDARAWVCSREMMQGAGFRHAFLGNYHRRQHLTPNDHSLGGMIGALRQVHRGHEGEPQGIEIWNRVDGEARWIEITEAPKYRTVRLEAGREPPERADGEKLTLISPPTTEIEELLLRNKDPDLSIIIERPPSAPRVEKRSMPDGVHADPRKMIQVFADSLQVADVETHHLIAHFNHSMSDVYPKGGSGCDS